MGFDIERLYALLPSFYRTKDTETGSQSLSQNVLDKIGELTKQLNGITDSGSAEASLIRNLIDRQQRGPLKALLAIIADQMNMLDENLTQLYEDLFIETCDEWVVPYIGDLVAARGIQVFPDALFSGRSQVANTISYRRRKGTAAVIEQLARDVTGWNSSVVEYFLNLATSQYVKHIRPGNLAVSGVRNREALERFNTPFDTMAHSVDVRNIDKKRGKYNINYIGIYLWRLNNYSRKEMPACKIDDWRYTFDALGKDIALYNYPVPEDFIAHLAEPVNVPMPLSRFILDKYTDTYYGNEETSSLLIYQNNIPVLTDPAKSSQQLSDVISICDLSNRTDSSGNVIGWNHIPAAKIAIDPALGRIAFPPSKPAPKSVRVNYYRGFSASLGGGEYGRQKTFVSDEPPIEVPLQISTISAALMKLSATGGLVEITRNDYYFETPVIQVAEDAVIELRAANEKFPVLVLNGDLVIEGGKNSKVILNGLLICGGSIRVKNGSTDNQLGTLEIIHCTILPGPVPGFIKEPAGTMFSSLIIETNGTIVHIKNSITGSINATDEATVYIINSITDATDKSGMAFSGLMDDEAGAILNVQNSTVIGRVYTRMMNLVSNSIFLADPSPSAPFEPPVLSDKLPEGCARFSYFPPAAKVPRRYRCQPENPDDPIIIKPLFTSLHYGDAGYCQLHINTDCAITKGADDEAEMGVFHDLYQPQRISNLQTRLNEYLPFGLQAGIFFGS